MAEPRWGRTGKCCIYHRTTDLLGFLKGVGRQHSTRRGKKGETAPPWYRTAVEPDGNGAALLVDRAPLSAPASANHLLYPKCA